MMRNITLSMSSNRVASLAAFLAGLAGLGTSLAGVWPNSTTNEIAQILGGVGTLSGPLSHVIGSWLWDRTPAGQAAGIAHSNGFGNTASDTDVPDDLPNQAIMHNWEWPGVEVEPWWDDQSSSDIENEEFGSDDPFSNDLGGLPNIDDAPKSALNPQSEQNTGDTPADNATTTETHTES